MKKRTRRDYPEIPYSTRSGVVALLGLPNAGKSTLLNRLVGLKLAAVTAKPQTTRSRILGIVNHDDAQLLLVDTPGIHSSARVLNQQMNAVAQSVLEDCDLAVLLVDASAGWGSEPAAILENLSARHVSVLLVATKTDLTRATEAPWPADAAARAVATCRISAKTGEGIEVLLDLIAAHLPTAPHLYGEEEVTDRPLRFLAAEAVREAAFECLEQELPYELGVEIVSFDEKREDLTKIRADLIVQRESQKRIVIGSGGQQIKQIGVRARQEIEALLDKKVHLELWVKVEPGWHKKKKRIESLGYY